MIYEYQCETCGKLIPKEYGMMDDHPNRVKCPDCITMSGRRLFTTSVHIPYDFNSPDNKIHTEKRNKRRIY